MASDTNSLTGLRGGAADGAGGGALWTLEGLRGAEPVLGLALIMLLAVVAADALVRWTRLPRATGWMLVGALAGPVALDVLHRGELDAWKPLLDLAIGVLVFELGSRIRPRWLIDNPGLAAACGLEGLLAGGLVAAALIGLGAAPASAVVAGAVAMSTSPVISLSGVHENASRGQVTERVLLMSAVNSVMAVLAIKLVHVAGVADRPDVTADIGAAAASAAYVAFGSFLLGVTAGWLLERLGRLARHPASLAVLQIALVVLATLLAARWTLSPLLALLAAGMVARSRMRHRLTVEPQLGTLGASLTVLLFVCIGLLFDFGGLLAVWPWVLAIIGARLSGKALAVALTARASGLGWRQAGALTLALQPMSGLLVLLAAASFSWDAALPGVDPRVLSALLAATALMQLSGPLWLQFGLQHVAGETGGGSST
jgi:Kef-type K+ transport system membrane component KefB